VTKDPSLDGGFSGRLQAGTSTVANGNEVGYSVRGSANIPVNDQLGFTVSAFARRDPGYIDNVFSGVSGINEGHAYGGLATLLWRPSEVVSLKVNAIYQDFKLDGAPPRRRP